MARVHDRKRQMKLQKAKSKRELARRKRGDRAQQQTPKAMIARGMTAPFGTCWVSAALEEGADASAPGLISVIVTRRVGDLLLPSMILVDRTCLGIKNAFVGAPQTELELERLRRDLAYSGDPLQETDLLTAQSVIFHALDYASSLGFKPHRDFVAGLIGERPETLLDTPLARPAQPLYVPGPDDDVPRILAQLDASVGEGNYVFVGGVDVLSSLVDALEDGELDPDELDADESDDDDVGLPASPERSRAAD